MISICKHTFFTCLFSTFSISLLYCAEVRETENAILLKGKNYTLHLSKADGSSLRFENKNEKSINLNMNSLWRAKFLDGSSVNSKHGVMTLGKDRVIYTFDTPEIKVQVSVVPYDESVDFLAKPNLKIKCL